MCPLGECERRFRNRRVTTVSSTGNFLAPPRSGALAMALAARRSRTPLKRSREVGELKPAAPKAAWQAAAPACGAFKDLRRTRSRAGIGSPRSALRASLGRPKRSRAVGGRKPAAVPSNGASLRAPRVARTLASAHLKRSRPVGERKPAAPQAACQAAAPARSNAAWPWSVTTEPSATHARARAAALVS